jgi:hypothetical protein
VAEVPGVLLRAASWGGMACSYGEVAGTDLAPAFRGLPDDACRVPHWCYVVKGSLRLRYTDGHEDVVRAGEIWYAPRGHVPAVFEEDTAWVEFSPQDSYDQLLVHLGLKAPA